MDAFDDDWELAPDTAHPNAAQLLTEPFYWDAGDENSPFGSERGAEVLEAYRVAIGEDAEPDGAELLAELLEQWDVDRAFAEGIPDEELAFRLEREHFHVLAYDDAVVALAFAELVFLGTASAEMAAAAIRCLQRQSTPELLEFRGWSDPDERRGRCEEMIEVLRAST